MGTILLSLPISLKENQEVSIMTSFFTATSATCVTGLIRVDTYSHWSWFGQFIIILLIQIGGIGFMTFCIYALTLAKKKIGIISRSIMQNSISSPHVGGIVKMTKFIILATFFIEALGAFFLSFIFCPKLGLVKGLWFSIFHSISAFCNAGFDLMGNFEPYSSLVSFQDNWYLNMIIMLLIIIGGLGFLVWKDIIDNRGHFSKMRLHTKIVITTTIILIFGGALFIYFCEQGNATILSSLFQSVTARTAGFNTVDLSKIRETTQLIIIILMFVGGSSGSTAGGIKTTTIAVMLVNIISMFKQKKGVEVFKRRISDEIVKMASCVLMAYLVLTLIVSLIICQLENISYITVLFECVSAIATVGLTIGITSQLGVISQCLLALLMLFGRVGSITFLLAFASNRVTPLAKAPAEKIQIG
ncbi:potassium transporter TrkG [Erysipelatoclostridium ramosum]|uniref:Potassium uptake protein, TrkH family n=4 Tax=Coprobacillaceae TaxID=2810280 RepID=B0N466_9FIRM|nr:MULTISPECIES: potassium transporter TrkG [Thomasclavelia]MBS6663658.1 Trk family potassium uptake protein [Coprobacillus sp.]RHS36780.1 Trk family potassium uptake protein [Coprobacillus sp. AF09-1A]EDS19238.1 potassium uptake protein, TrkH family [Thomasclavelia ramosa DSM 1402]MBU9875385.1 Trk family potassium uptake protein [Thomasclavelia ramosa]MBU9903292.1 Trk family potassium uptake protein [Thomasclavelia ramosa]